MSGLHNAMGLQLIESDGRQNGKWSPRKTTLFVIGTCTVCWSLLIGKAALIL